MKYLRKESPTIPSLKADGVYADNDMLVLLYVGRVRTPR